MSPIRAASTYKIQNAKTSVKVCGRSPLPGLPDEDEIVKPLMPLAFVETGVVMDENNVPTDHWRDIFGNPFDPASDAYSKNPLADIEPDCLAAYHIAIGPDPALVEAARLVAMRHQDVAARDRQDAAAMGHQDTTAMGRQDAASVGRQDAAAMGRSYPEAAAMVRQQTAANATPNRMPWRPTLSPGPHEPLPSVARG